MDAEPSTGLMPKKEHTSRKGDTYIVQPLMKIADIPGFPAGFEDKALMVREGMIVHMTKKPLSDAERAANKKARRAETEEMKRLKGAIKDEYKAAKSDWAAEVKRATEELRQPSETALLNFTKVSKKWSAVRGTRTLAETKDILEKLRE